MRRWLVIANPTAGGGRAGRRLPALLQALRTQGLSFDVVQTSAAADAAELARRTASQCDGMLAVGGDGTVHEIVNGLSLERPPLLAIAPYGTGNDFARGLGLPTNPDKIATLMARARIQQLPIGEVRYSATSGEHTRRFINGTGLGLDAAVLERLPGHGPRALAYLVGTLRTLWRFRARDASICLDGQLLTGRYLLLYAGLGTRAGGGMQLTPHAGQHTGKLAITLVPEAPLRKILAFLPALYRGTLDRTDGLTCTHATRLQINAAHFRLEADGQLLGTGPVEIYVRPERLSVIARLGPEADNEDDPPLADAP